jgi:hypothetical protein
MKNQSNPAKTVVLMGRGGGSTQQAGEVGQRNKQGRGVYTTSRVLPAREHLQHGPPAWAHLRGHPASECKGAWVHIQCA